MGEYEPEDSRNVTGANQRQTNQSQTGQRQSGQSQSGQQPQQGIRSPGGADQQIGGARWNGDYTGGQTGQQGEHRNQGTGGARSASSGPESAQQQQQFPQDTQMGGAADTDQGRGSGMRDHIREHMEVIGADGAHIGMVDGIEGDRIKLTKKDSGAGFEGGTHEGHHHYLSCGLVAAVEDDRVRLSANADTAWGMIEER